MFLALREIYFNKRKFGLIISLVVLITYLVYFLISLAYGLASSYTNGITKNDGDYILLSSNSNDNAMMSRLSHDDFINLDVNGRKERLGLFPAVTIHENKLESTKEEVYVFGVDNISFFLSNESILELENNEVIVDDSFKKLGYKIGDKVTITDTLIEWEIIGFTNKATYQTAPILFVNMETWMNYRFEDNTNTFYNAIFVKGNITTQPSSLKGYTIKEFASTLPGYTAQVLTFSIMIGFLVIIISFVLGIFIYVVTIQKISIFGVMKAQGISNSYIGLSVILQTLFIVVIGSFFGFLLTMISGYFLSGIVPFAINSLFYGGITIAFILFSTISGMFSVSTVVKIDPLKAIG